MTELRWAADGSDAAVAHHLAQLLARPGAKALAVPGGSTPGPILADLAQRGLDWSGVTVLPTDERLVPADDPASNVGALRRGLAGTGSTVQPLTEATLPPHFDLAWIGMGSDGHVASLFPSSDPDPQAPAGVVRLTPDPLPPEAPYARLSLTLAALADSDTIILVARGAAKRAVLEAAARGENDLPVARLLGLAPVTVFWSQA